MHIFWLSEQESTQTGWFLKTGVHPCSASQSLTAEWPRSWSGTAASGLGISYFCATMIPLQYSHKISVSVADLNGITKGKRRWAEIPSFRDRRTQCGASVNVKLRWSITLNQLDWYEPSSASKDIWFGGVWFTALWWCTVRRGDWSPPLLDFLIHCVCLVCIKWMRNGVENRNINSRFNLHILLRRVKY